MSVIESKPEVKDPQLDQEKETQKDFAGIKTTLYKDPNTGERYAIPVSMSPNPTIDRILTYVNRTGFCGILNIGMSGTGKSTWSRQLIHKLHTKHNFVIHYHERDDIQKLDKIIQGLTKGLDHVILMDDASFSLEQLKREDMNKITQQLTYVRHETKGKVIVIMNIHYSKAISRFFRNVPFIFLTSITMSEVHAFQDVFPHARWKLRDFAWYFQQMMFNNRFVFDVDKWKGKRITYETDKPFRLGLALEGNAVHFYVYLREGCVQCDPEFTNKRVMNSQELVQQLVNSYGVEKTRSMLRTYSFTRHGIKTLDATRQSLWNTISEFDRSNQINWKNVNKILDKQLTKRRPRSYLRKEKEKAKKKKILDGVTTTEATEATKELEEFKEEMSEGFKALDENKELPRELDQELGYDPESSNPIDMPYGFPDEGDSQDFNKEQV